MQRLFNNIGRLGIGLAIGAGVANSALYNGKFFEGRTNFF